MRDCNQQEEQRFLALFDEFFNAERDARKQHDPNNYSLDRMIPLAELVGHPERKLKLLHVAGTKGKGTTTQFLDALIRSCGKKCAFFASPHISTYRERFQVNGGFLSYERMYEAGVDIVNRVHNAGLKPSLFEIFTVMALKLFVDEGMEYAVLETGIGGRLDSTNYIQHPEMTLIAPVSFDHMALLGNTIEQIAGEKAGILKPGVPVVLLKQPYKEAEDVVRKRAAELGCPVLTPLSHEECAPYLPNNLPDFLIDNFGGALAAIRALGFNPQPSQFKMPQLRARFDKICDDPLVLLDGAHNADSMQKLVAALNKIYPEVHWTVVLGCVLGKDVHGMVDALKNLRNAKYILTNPRTYKGTALPQLQEAITAAGLPVICTIDELKSRSQLPAGPLLFTGSFFTTTIGEDLFN